MSKNKKIIIIISIVLLFGIFLFKSNLINVANKAIKDGILSIQTVVTYPINIIEDKINKHKFNKNLLDKYLILRDKYDENIKYKIENDELKMQINELKKILNVPTLINEYELINASVITRDVTNWYNTIIINKGERDGISIGMAVMSNNYLVGKIINTSFNNSTVKLLSSSIEENISVKIKLEDDYAYGILNTNTGLIKGISSNKIIKHDSIVTTTGLSEIYPAGIAIGTVEKIETDEYDLSNVIKINYFSDFNINYVSVLKRKI